ncbi:hypothetical protein NP233_g10448 [Leucocoprinus birnbaumii]|uniref:Uncharacterized protein n=1 Tax=Leucocoprinus birnbaumii TaxID=56174 RepID=A0AAD5VIG3_9AGAR|nr:hypothetical protein NP233_g10448 [Leucocoprinus birnbaumii]
MEVDEEDRTREVDEVHDNEDVDEDDDDIEFEEVIEIEGDDETEEEIDVEEEVNSEEDIRVEEEVELVEESEVGKEVEVEEEAEVEIEGVESVGDIEMEEQVPFLSCGSLKDLSDNQISNTLTSSLILTTSSSVWISVSARIQNLGVHTLNKHQYQERASRRSANRAHKTIKSRKQVVDGSTGSEEDDQKSSSDSDEEEYEDDGDESKDGGYESKDGRDESEDESEIKIEKPVIEACRQKAKGHNTKPGPGPMKASNDKSKDKRADNGAHWGANVPHHPESSRIIASLTTLPGSAADRMARKRRTTSKQSAHQSSEIIVHSANVEEPSTRIFNDRDEVEDFEYAHAIASPPKKGQRVDSKALVQVTDSSQPDSKPAMDEVAWLPGLESPFEDNQACSALVLSATAVHRAVKMWGGRHVVDNEAARDGKGVIHFIPQQGQGRTPTTTYSNFSQLLWSALTETLMESTERLISVKKMNKITDLVHEFNPPKKPAPSTTKNQPPPNVDKALLILDDGDGPSDDSGDETSHYCCTAGPSSKLSSHHSHTSHSYPGSGNGTASCQMPPAAGTFRKVITSSASSSCSALSSRSASSSHSASSSCSPSTSAITTHNPSTAVAFSNRSLSSTTTKVRPTSSSHASSSTGSASRKSSNNNTPALMMAPKQGNQGKVVQKVGHKVMKKSN